MMDEWWALTGNDVDLTLRVLESIDVISDAV